MSEDFLKPEKPDILDVLEEHVFHLDMDQKIIWANRAACESAGISVEELIGRYCYEIWGDGVRICRDCTVIETLGSGQAAQGECESADGRRWILKSYPIKNSDGEITGAVEVKLDTTSMKKAEILLLAQRDMAREVLDIAGVMILSLNEAGEIALINRKGLDILGYENEDEVLGLNWFENFLPEGVKGIYQKKFKDFIAASPDVEDWHDENPIVTGDGEERIISWNNKARRDEKGRIIGTLSSGEDITLRRQAEQENKETLAKLESVFKAAPTGIGVVVNRVVKWSNEKLTEITGYSREELVGQDARLVYPDQEEYEFVGREKYRQISEKGTGTVETRWKRKDGTIIDVLLSSTPIDPDDLSVGVTFTVLDITERKHIEQEIQSKNVQLEKALRVKTDFMSMVSHELRTPLVPIMGYTEVLLDGSLGELPEEAVMPLKTIMSRSQDLMTLIEDLLVLSRVERAKIKLDLESLPVMKHIRETIADYESTTHDKELVMECRGENFEIYVDHTRFHQILRNLIDNALKYSGPEIEITVTTSVEGRNGLITVADNGIGIEEEHIPYIFDRFYQIESIDTRTHGGTGLGLAISKELAEAMEGTITVESRVGEGSVFAIRLPLA